MANVKTKTLSRTQWNQQAKTQVQAAFAEIQASAQKELETSQKQIKVLREKVKKQTAQEKVVTQKIKEITKKLTVSKTVALKNRLKSAKAKLVLVTREQKNSQKILDQLTQSVVWLKASKAQFKAGERTWLQFNKEQQSLSVTAAVSTTKKTATAKVSRSSKKTTAASAKTAKKTAKKTTATKATAASKTSKKTVTAVAKKAASKTTKKTASKATKKVASSTTKKTAVKAKKTTAKSKAAGTATVAQTQLNVGDVAPAWSASAQDPNRVLLQDLRGKKVILYFYPKDNTPGCTKQAIALTEAQQTWADANTVVVGVSRDSVASHEHFIEKHGLSVQLISDEDEAVCQSFGVIKDKNLYGKVVRGVERSTFLIDEQGRIQQVWRNVKVDQHIENLRSAVCDVALT